MYGAPTATARNWAANLFGQASQERARGDRFLGAAYAEKQRDRDAFLAALKFFADALHRREAEKAAKEKEGGWFGLGGAGLGAGLGAILAAPTGGLSVLGGAALGAGAGAGIGSAIDVATGGSPRAGQQISAMLPEFALNPFFVEGPGNRVGEYIPGPMGGRMRDEPYGFVSGYR